MTKEELIELSDLNREDNIKYISSEAQGIAITLDSDRYAPTFCKLERAYICGRRKSEEQIAELEAQIEQNKIDVAILEHDREHNDYELTEVYTKLEQLEKENAELKEENENLKKTYRKQRNKRIDDLQKENAELDCQKNRNKFCYSCANATERCFRNEIGCPCEKYKSYKDENAELEAQLENLKPYRCKNHFQVSETGNAVVCYRVYDCKSCGQFKEVKEKEKDKEKPEVQRRELSFDHRAQSYVGE